MAFYHTVEPARDGAASEERAEVGVDDINARIANFYVGRPKTDARARFFRRCLEGRDSFVWWSIGQIGSRWFREGDVGGWASERDALGVEFSSE